MSHIDLETVNERLNGLVNLLKAVGVDESGTSTNYNNPNGKQRNSSSRNNNNNNNNNTPSIHDAARQLDDQQIAAIIQKLQTLLSHLKLMWLFHI